MPTAPSGERSFTIMANVDAKPNTKRSWACGQKKNVVCHFSKQRMPHKPSVTAATNDGAP